MIEASYSQIKAKYQDIFRPLHRLPPEVLLQNFTECVEDEEPRRMLSTMSRATSYANHISHCLS